MFEELCYRWALRKFLKDYDLLSKSYEASNYEEPKEDEPDIRRSHEREFYHQTVMIDGFRSQYLVRQAYFHHVPIPEKDEDWEQPRFASERYLTAEAATRLRTAIRAEQKSNWDYWANRVTLSLALVGSIFGVLAYFKK